VIRYYNPKVQFYKCTHIFLNVIIKNIARITMLNVGMLSARFE